MSTKTFEMHKEMLKLRNRVLQAEQERLDGAKTLSISEARKKLKGMPNK